MAIRVYTKVYYPTYRSTTQISKHCAEATVQLYPTTSELFHVSYDLYMITRHSHPLIPHLPLAIGPTLSIVCEKK